MATVVYGRDLFFKRKPEIIPFGDKSKIPFEVYDYNAYEMSHKSAVQEYSAIKKKGKGDLKSFLKSKGINSPDGKKNYNQSRLAL